LADRCPEDDEMRKTLTALAVLLLWLPAGAAQAQYAPWCAFYNDSMSGENCGFVSLEQCRLEVRGIGGVCYPNPSYAAAPARRGKQPAVKRPR
jgi:Protein of unknown function (DUF3551)